MREHKRKRLAEEQSLDMRPIKIKKYLNSSERWRGKREIDEQYGEHQPDVDNLRWNMEMEQSNKCWEEESLGPAARLAETLFRLGLGVHELYTCTCEDFTTLSDDEILKRNGY